MFAKLPAPTEMKFFEPLGRWFGGSKTALELTRRLPAEAPVPTIWMLGKTGSGKSSIISTITGADPTMIGNGFQPKTKHAQEFAFPEPQSPIVRFIDTRGIGEAVIDSDQPQGDDSVGDQADLLLITIRVTDHATAELVQQLKSVRRQFPAMPVVLALTALHDAYPGRPHPVDLQDHLAEVTNLDAQVVPDDLRRNIQAQLDRVDGLYDAAVAIDLTPIEDGFEPHDLGADRLFATLLNQIPAAIRQTLKTMRTLRDELQDVHRQKIDTVILAHATVAAGAAAVPVPWVDMPVVIGMQTHLAHRIAKLHGQSLDAAALARLSATIGGRTATGLLIRSFSKAIPWVGSAVNSASAFAMTLATGKVCHWYFVKTADGSIPEANEIAEQYRQQLSQAQAYWNQRHPPR